MKKLLTSAIIALLPMSAMSATILGFQAGAGVWEHDPSGSIKTVLDGANAGDHAVGRGVVDQIL